MAVDSQQKRMAVADRVFPATKDGDWRATVAGAYPFTFQVPTESDINDELARIKSILEYIASQV